jgi:hypothetical protein
MWMMSVHIYETHKVKVVNMEVKIVYLKEKVDCQQSVRRGSTAILQHRSQILGFQEGI